MIFVACENIAHITFQKRPPEAKQLRYAFLSTSEKDYQSDKCVKTLAVQIYFSYLCNN